MKKPAPDFDWTALEAIGGVERKEELHHGVGFTASEMATRYGVSQQHASSRIRAMLVAGTIKRIGYRRDAHGRLSTAVYDLVEKPRP